MVSKVQCGRKEKKKKKTGVDSEWKRIKNKYKYWSTFEIATDACQKISLLLSAETS